MKRNLDDHVDSPSKDEEGKKSPGEPSKKVKRQGPFEPRTLTIADSPPAKSAARSTYRLGLVKFFLPKWDKYFVHLFSSDEGVTDFVSIPKAVKELHSWLIAGTGAGADPSRLESDRLWVGQSDLANFTLLSDVVIWPRPEEGSHASSACKSSDTEWQQCSECDFLLAEDEPRVACGCCDRVYHADCLFAFEKIPGRGYDPEALDAQGKRYLKAHSKWRARKTSKCPSLMLEDDGPDSPTKTEATLTATTLDVIEPKIVCPSCRECRFCCQPLLEDVFPTVSASASPIEPFVICVKCNTAAHGHCVFPAVPKLHQSVQWMCDDCRECNSCGRVTYLEDATGMPSLLTDWALPSFDQCRRCFAGLDKGEYCPVCMKAWSVEWGGDMVQCDGCEFWVHVSCDNLGSVNISKLGSQSVKYNCPICRDSTDVHRRLRVIDLLRAIDKVALFSEPVSAAYAAVYLKVIRNPMDLSKMRKKEYKDNYEFIADFELIVDNAKMFNMPNSPAYRLAEQFHKQGKLLIEKYLLMDRKGASQIEGLTVETGSVGLPDAPAAAEDVSSGSSRRRQASLQAGKSWRKDQTVAETGPGKGAAAGKRKISYDAVVEMIKRRSANAGGNSKGEARKPMGAVGGVKGEVAENGEVGGGIISPYRRRLSGGRMTSSNLLSSPLSGGTLSKPHSVTDALMLTPPTSDLHADGAGGSKLLMSEEEVEKLAGKIFGFKHSKFTLPNLSSFDNQSGVVQIAVSADFSRVLQTCSSVSRISPNEIAEDIRWTLYDSCAICGSYGEPWNFVECSDCAQCVHWYCVGLIASPSKSFIPSHMNPLIDSTTSGTDNSLPQYRCSDCVRCKYCSNRALGEDVHKCSLCGTACHIDCRKHALADPSSCASPTSPSETTSGPPVFQLTPSHSICDECVLTQSLHYFKAETCKACSTLINPNVASCLLQAMPKSSDAQNEGEGVKGAPALVTGKVNPLVHCVGCGDVWHARCIPEFEDIGTSDVLGMYMCESCSGETGGADQSELLHSMSLTLKKFRTKTYREIQAEYILETLGKFGVSTHASVIADLIDIFQQSIVSEYSLTDPNQSTLAATTQQWLEWCLVHKEFLLGLGNPVLDHSKRRSASGALEQLSSNSIRVKRAEDEDLLLVKRLVSLLASMTGEKTQDAPAVVSGEGDLADIKDEATAMSMSQLVCKRNPIFDGCELGSNWLKQDWIRNGENNAYTGPGVVEPGARQPWDTRQCCLCGIVGDHTVCGLLVYSNSSWVHTECAAWALSVYDPESVVDKSAAKLDWKYARPIQTSFAVPSSGDVGLTFSVEELNEVVTQSAATTCIVCGRIGASVQCQSCRGGAVFHLHCALTVNSTSPGVTGGCRVLMDSRCRLLTCGKCLYRYPDLDKSLTAQFAKLISQMRTGESATTLVQATRQLEPVRVTTPPAVAPGPVKEGTVTIVRTGSFSESFVYDGTQQIVPRGYVAVRLSWMVDLVYSAADEVNGVTVTQSQSQMKQLRKRRRGAYLCRVSERGDFFSIEVLGGRAVAVGASLDEVWTEFKSILLTAGGKSRLPSYMTGAWFFGLETLYMRRFLAETAMSSIKRQAGIHRDRWLYQPQLRGYITAALGLKSDLKPVSSIRRNLISRIPEYESKIDQLRSLGRVDVVTPDSAPPSTVPDMELLKPDLVLCEKISNADDSNGKSSTRAKSVPLDASAFSDYGTKYKIRSAIADVFLLAVKRSRIHNYGLFAVNGFSKSDLVVEYQGEILRQTIADEREKKSERDGDGDGGSCYMFKLDDDYVVDATVRGNCARFINHSCNPNCSCKLIEDEFRQKHIMIVAKRDIAPGEEITYDYQFAVESEKLACLCGAPNCLGRLN